VRTALEKAGGSVKSYVQQDLNFWYDLYSDVDSPLLKKVRPHLKKVIEILIGKNDKSARPHYIHNLSMFWTMLLERYYEPFMNKAYNDLSITAWVAESDHTGLILQNWLERRKKNKRKIAVVSFDDTVESFCAGLSSYSFNTQAVVLSIINHICSQSNRRKRPSVPIEITGSVIERDSSR
jgi:hypothetical protein